MQKQDKLLNKFLGGGLFVAFFFFFFWGGGGERSLRLLPIRSITIASCVIFVELKCIGVERFLRFSRKRQNESVPIVFKVRKHLIITTLL